MPPSFSPASRRRRQQRAFTGQLRNLQELLGELNDIETRREPAPELFEGGDEAVQAEATGLIDQAVQGYEAARELGPYWR